MLLFKIYIVLMLSLLSNLSEAKIPNAMSGETNNNRKSKVLLPRIIESSSYPSKQEDRMIGISAAAAVAAATKSSNSAAQLKTSETLRGVLCVIGGALCHLALGTLYCWANFMSYSPEKLRFFDGKAHPGKTADAMLVIPLTMMAQALALPFGPTIVSKIGASRTLLLGSWIMALSVYLASFAQSLSVFLAFYSFVFGAGIGIAYTAPMLAGYKWLPQSKGLVSGGVLAGFGMGGFFFNLIGTKLVNPKGLNPVAGKFPGEVYAGFGPMLRKLAIIYAALTLVGSLLVTEPKPTTVATKQTSSPSSKAIKASAGPEGVEVKEALKSNQFYLLWLMILSSASAGLNVASAYKQFAGVSPALAGDSFQALVGGLGALFNGCGRLFWGGLSDKIGFKNSFVILTVVQTALQFLYPYSGSSKVNMNELYFVIIVIIHGIFFLSFSYSLFSLRQRVPLISCWLVPLH